MSDPVLQIQTLYPFEFRDIIRNQDKVVGYSDGRYQEVHWADRGAGFFQGGPDLRIIQATLFIKGDYLKVSCKILNNCPVFLLGLALLGPEKQLGNCYRTELDVRR